MGEDRRLWSAAAPDLSTWSWADDDDYSEEWTPPAEAAASRVTDDTGRSWWVPGTDCVVRAGDDLAIEWDTPALVVTRAKPGPRVWWAPWRRRTTVDRYPLREVTDG